MASLPQYMPGLLRKEVSELRRFPPEVQLALTSRHSILLQLVGQCSGPHLRRTDNKNPTLGAYRRSHSSFKLK
jgi:hypothetical protein